VKASAMPDGRDGIAMVSATIPGRAAWRRPRGWPGPEKAPGPPEFRT
jgi:hypothetical protein